MAKARTCVEVWPTVPPVAEFGSVASRLALSQANTFSPSGLISIAAMRHCRSSMTGELEYVSQS